MTIWWCEEHGFNGGYGNTGWLAENVCLWAQVGIENHETEATPCRMVEMDLIPHETWLTGVTEESLKP